MAVFTNQATLSYSGGVTNSNVTTGELLETVSVSKTAVSQSYTPGERVTYAVSIVNTGETASAALTVTDDLGGYEFEGETVYPLAYVPDSLRYFVNGVLQTVQPTVTAGPPLTVTGIDIPAESNVLLLYEAEATRFAPLGEDASVTNTVTVTGGAAALTASATLPMAAEPQLTISKALSPDTVTDGGELTYTFVIQNSGSEAGADDAIVITDTFDPILSDITVTLDDAPMSAADYTYDEATGEFATVSGRVTVPGATYEQAEDGSWITTPGVTVLTITGTV